MSPLLYNRVPPGLSDVMTEERVELGSDIRKEQFNSPRAVIL